MSGVMAPQAPAPRPRRRLRRRKPWRCRLGRHVTRGEFWTIEPSPWKTMIRYCVNCGHVEDAHARKFHR